MSTIRTICLLTDERLHVRVVRAAGRRAEVVGRGSVEHEVPVSLLLEPGLAGLASAIREAVQTVEGASRELTLVVPQTWCFQHMLAGGPRMKPEALRYEFEGFVPLPLEELTVVFRRIDTDQTLTVAVPTEAMARLIAGLAEVGIQVEQIAVDGLEAGAFDGSEARDVMIADRRWCRVALDTGSTSRRSLCLPALQEAQAPVELFTAILPRVLPPENQMPHRWRWLDLRGDADELAIDGLDIVHVAGDSAVDAILLPLASRLPVVDLAVGSLAGRRRRDTVPRLLSQCLAAAIVLALVAAVGLHVKARRLDAVIAGLEDRERAAYRSVFPVEQVPPGAALRLASERIRLEGLTRKGNEPAAVAAGRPLAQLREAVAGLPTDVRILLAESRIDEQQFLLRGQTVEHRDAERIAEAVGRVPGVDIRPPRTTRLKSGGVEFTIVAVRRGGRE